MRKRLALIVLEDNTRKHYMDQLWDFFGDRVEVQGYALDTDEIGKTMEADLFLISLPEAAMQVADYLPSNAQITYINRSFDSDKVDQLKEFEDGTEIMVFDNTRKYALETMAVLNEVGYGNLHFIAVSPEDEKNGIPAIDVAVTVGGDIAVPNCVKKVIIIGWYCIDVLTLVDVVEKLGLEDDGIDRKIYDYSKKLKMTKGGLFHVYEHLWELKNRWDSIIDMLDDGIILTDTENRIILCNSFAARLMEEVGSGQNLIELLYHCAGKELRHADSFQNRLFDIEGLSRRLVVSKRPLCIYEGLRGYLFLLKDSKEIQEIEQKLRIVQTRKGFQAKYTFDRIVTASPLMKDMISFGKKVARTDYAVLITGESGVGKEMFAQSIHNYSSRKDMPFVAVNCAALPESLLESELFGYEEGAFTGAKKGGKKGLFELAHRGTIFLDEIGEMPLPLQANLLRVVQEKEVMRVGGGTVIPVDVRIIAASNGDFQLMLDEKRFRLDLYYRLKTMHIPLPNLNSRPEDIELLAAHYLKEEKDMGRFKDQEMDRGLILRLKQIRWRGNVRELNSCVNYMKLMGGKLLTVADLPYEYFGMWGEEKGPDRDIDDRTVEALILHKLSSRPMGRRRLMQAVREEGYDVTEYKVRTLMKGLEAAGKIKIGTDKRGSSTVKGQ